MPTRVKICGITRPEDAALAAELGADAIGLNFVGGPRKIEWKDAVPITGAIRRFPFVSAVALISPNSKPDTPTPPVADMLTRSVAQSVQYVQAYQTQEFANLPGESILRAFNGINLWVVYQIGSRSDVSSLLSRLKADPFAAHAQCVVLDTASKAGQLGGTGQAFDWNWIAEARAAGELGKLYPIILAGGLTPDNVATAIRIARPYAVDVSSGVEVPGKPGIKDPIKMRDFIQAAKSAI